MKKGKNPLTIVVFGATGDLYQKKLALALFHLFSKGVLPKHLRIVGFSRRPMADGEFQNFTRDAILQNSRDFAPNLATTSERLADFLGHIKYLQGNLESRAHFRNLSEVLARDDAKDEICSDKLFYLAVPPSLYASVFENIAKAGLTVPCAPETKNRHSAWTRVLVEKPFGKDMREAKQLDKMLGKLFDESQIFRIDHYLAKEAMQNILAFRFSSGILESVWNSPNIRRVRIVLHEKDALATRGAFYDGVGALRDVGQNHLLEMLALIAMDKPKDISPEEIRRARGAVLTQTKLALGDNPMRGQYDGYLKEPGVDPHSKTETFFRAVLSVGNARWRGVSFDIESGKALDRGEVFIEIYFRDVEACLRFPISSTRHVSFDAYQKVFLDCILGDQTIFVSTEEVMAEWRIVEDIIKKWRYRPLVIYPQGVSATEVQ